MKSPLSLVLSTLALASLSAGAAAPAPSTIGLKNFREILSSLEEGTGIPAKTPSVAAAYRKVSSRLPVHGQLEELSSPTVLALVELSGAFCNELVQKEAGLDPSGRRYFLFVNFQSGPSQFSPAAWARIATDFSLAFWQREPSADEMALYQDLLSKFKPIGDTSAVTAQALQAVCVHAASSLAFLTNGT